MSPPGLRLAQVCGERGCGSPVCAGQLSPPSGRSGCWAPTAQSGEERWE